MRMARCDEIDDGGGGATGFLASASLGVAGRRAGNDGTGSPSRSSGVRNTEDDDGTVMTMIDGDGTTVANQNRAMDDNRAPIVQKPGLLRRLRNRMKRRRQS